MISFPSMKCSCLRGRSGADNQCTEQPREILNDVRVVLNRFFVSFHVAAICLSFFFTLAVEVLPQKFTVDVIGRDLRFTCRLTKAHHRIIMSQVRLENSPVALGILSPLFMSPQVGPWEQAERGPVSIRNTGRHNGLCLQLHCWQTPTQRSWKGSPSVLTHTEEWVSVLPLRAVFVQYIQLLSTATVLPSMGAEVLMKTRRNGLLSGCQWEFMFIRWALRPLQGTCMGAEQRRATEQPVIGLLDG